MNTYKAFIGCEYSGQMRRAFQARGWSAISCDLLPADDGVEGITDYSGHWQGDMFDVLAQLCDEQGGVFDIMIFHPPCTYLTNAGVRWLYKGGRGTERDSVRWAAMLDAADFFRRCRSVPRRWFRGEERRVVVENPIPHKWAALPPYTQVIQPWEHGHGETKATALWLEGLPALVPSNVVEGRKARVHHESPGPDRWKRRSTTLTGIAEACAKQWGDYVESRK